MGIHDVAVRIDYTDKITKRPTKKQFIARVKANGVAAAMDLAANAVYEFTDIDKKSIKNMPIIGVWGPDANRKIDVDTTRVTISKPIRNSDAHEVQPLNNIETQLEELNERKNNNKRYRGQKETSNQ